LVAPIIAYIVTKRICLGLQRKDAHLLEYGIETGIIEQRPNGEFHEITRPVTDEDDLAVLHSRPDYPPLPGRDPSAEGVPAPGMRGAIGKVRERLYDVVTESVPLPTGPAHGNGHGNGHAIEGNGHSAGSNGHSVEGDGPAPAAVPAGSEQADASAEGDDTDA
jgi:ubiquinol-cytochrome c reductase cytochrome b subunit